MWSNNSDQSKGLIPGRRSLGPLFLLLVPPLFVLVFWFTNAHLDGSFLALLDSFWQHGFWNSIWKMHPSMINVCAQAKIIFPYMIVELIFMRVLPGDRFEGPISPSGHIPIYKANGIVAYISSLLCFSVIVWAGILPLGYLCTNLGAILTFMCYFSLVFCLFLYLKGHITPTGKDSGSSNNIIIDYYWGMELYPRIFGWDVKVFTNCRFGMMGWAILLLDFMMYQYKTYGFIADSMFISVGLQLVYITKFFYWETGYFKSMDIMHDRAGYYICWGCMVWLPCIYTSQGFYLALHPVVLGLPLSMMIFMAGLICIWINYDADRQRQEFRQKDGKVKIWGKPAEKILASYTTELGQKKTSLLLVSGWWGLSRHFHYIPEIMASLCWSLPALFTHFYPYFYVCYLILLLVDRAYRDDERCRDKYGEAWEKYCSRVPYKIIPKVL